MRRPRRQLGPAGSASPTSSPSTASSSTSSPLGDAEALAKRTTSSGNPAASRAQRGRTKALIQNMTSEIVNKKVLAPTRTEVLEEE